MPLKNRIARKKYHAKYMRDVWYPKNRKKHIGYVRNLKAKIRAFLEDYKRKETCKDCGYPGSSFPSVLEFDHQGGKRFGIGDWSKSVLSLESLVKEMNKCELVCANCHRIRTAKRGMNSAGGSQRGFR